MFLKLNHKSLLVYVKSSELITEIYKITADLPRDEKYNLVQQIRRAALSVKLNLAEGCSRKSIAERKRYFEVSRGSLIEIDAVLEVAVEIKLISKEKLSSVCELINFTFALFSKMINGTK